jgi:hypothetical protein
VRAEDTDAHLYRSRPAYDFLYTCPSMMAPINSRVVRADALPASAVLCLHACVPSCVHVRLYACERACVHVGLCVCVHTHVCSVCAHVLYRAHTHSHPYSHSHRSHHRASRPVCVSVRTLVRVCCAQLCVCVRACARACARTRAIERVCVCVRACAGPAVCGPARVGPGVRVHRGDTRAVAEGSGARCQAGARAGAA